MANYTRFQLRGDTKANWLSVNPILAKNEPAIETDTKRFKIGDGVSTYSQLSYGRNTGEYASLYNVTSLYPLPSGFYEHATAILAIPISERLKGLIITYVTASGVWYTERFIGTNVSGWTTVANWEKLPDAGDLAQLRSDLSKLLQKHSGLIDKMRYDNTIDSFVFDETAFLTQLIPIPSGVTSINWNYGGASNVKLIILDAQFQFIDYFSQFAGSSRTVNLPQNTSYIRAAFDWDVHSDNFTWSVTYGKNVILWDEGMLFMERNNIDEGINPFSAKVAKSKDVYANVFALAGLIPNVIVKNNPSTGKPYYDYDEQAFLTELIPLNGATSIHWYYHTQSLARLPFYDSDKRAIDSYGQVGGDREISVPSGAVFIRGAFDWRKHSTLKDWKITDNNGNVLWEEAMLSYEMLAAIKELKESMQDVDNYQLKLFNIPSAQNPTNNYRLNHAGKLDTWSGGVFKTSRLIPVKVGDVVTFTGASNGTSAPLVGFSTDSYGVENFVADLIPEGTYTIKVQFKKSVVITNDVVKYVASCGYINNGAFDFDVEVAPGTNVEDMIVMSSLHNYYPNAMSKAGGFVQKYLNGEDVNIVLLGDSITAVANQKQNTNLNKIPCFMEHQNWCYWLWKYLYKNDNIIYRRYDYQSFFSYTGDFTETSVNSIEPYNYNSSDENAAFQFDWNLANYEKTNIILPKDGSQCYQGIKIEVLSNGAATDGIVEYYNGTTWVEANGVVLSLRLSVDTDGTSTCRNMRHKFRRVGASGAVSIRVSKNGTEGKLLLWGVEQWNGQGVFISNAAWGGKATYELQSGHQTSLIGHRPDLVLFELTLVNNFGDRMYESNSKELMYNDFYDYIWGDRPDHTNTLSLKALSNNWVDWQVVLVVPHWRQQWVDGDNFKMTIEGTPVKYSALDCYNVVKGLIRAKNDLEYLNLGAEMKREAFQRGLTLEQSYNGITDETMDSIDCFTQDTVHLNNLGSKIYGKYIAPIFDI